MSKKEEFILEVEGLLNSVGNYEWQSDGAKLFWESLKSNNQPDKPLFTENGKLILKFLQDNKETNIWKSRDIAEKMFVSSRTVSGSLRKLVTDGYVEKLGENPVIYSLTEKGKNVDINKENE